MPVHTRRVQYQRVALHVAALFVLILFGSSPSNSLFAQAFLRSASPPVTHLRPPGVIELPHHPGLEESAPAPRLAFGIASARPVLSPHGRFTSTLEVGTVQRGTLSVTNGGTVTGSYVVTQNCPAIMACTRSTNAFSLAPGASTSFDYTYMVPTTPGTVVYGESIVTTTSGGGASGSIVEADTTGLTVTAADLNPPMVIIDSPNQNAVLTAFTAMTAAWCDLDGVLVTHTARLDGTPLDGVFVPFPKTVCTDGGTTTWPAMPLTVGPHTLIAEATDGAGHTTTVTRNFSFSLPDVASYQPTVTPYPLASIRILPGPLTVAFLVRNAGSLRAQYAMTAVCATGLPCVVDKPTVTLDPGAADTVHMSVIVPNLPGAYGTSTMTATYTDVAGRSVSSVGAMTGTIPSIAELYQPQVLDVPGIAVGLPGMIPGLAFTVRNAGLLPATYSVSSSGSNGYTEQSTALPATITLAPGESEFLVPNYRIPFNATSDGVISLTLSVTVGQTTLSSTGHATIGPTQPIYSMEIGPKNSTVLSSVNPVGFTYQATGNAFFYANTTVTCTGAVINCRGSGAGFIGQLFLTQNVQTLPVTYDFDPTRGPAGTVKFVAIGVGAVSSYRDSATISISNGLPYVAVRVSPHAITKSAVRNAVSIQRFDIANIGTDDSAYGWQVHCSGSFICNDTAGTTPSLGHGPDSASVVIRYQTGDVVSTDGAVKLVASSLSQPAVKDSGMVLATLSVANALKVSVGSANPGATVARDQCLTISAGESAAYECGDLRLDHELPTTTTMGRARTPTLVYNSAHATGTSVIAADVSAPAGIQMDHLSATLVVTAGDRVSHTYRYPLISWNPALSDGLPHRIVLPFSADSLNLQRAEPAGAFHYRVDVRSAEDQSPAAFASDTGVVIVVDRRASPFGAGWWLDGWEQLMFAPAGDAASRLWIGGDGSTRIYSKAGTSDSVWTVQPTADRPDMLVRLSSGNYRRLLPNGAYVEFNPAGVHIATVNQLAQKTSFFADLPSEPRLVSRIVLPVKAGPQPTYQFFYEKTAAAGPTLSRVWAPGGRIDSVSYQGSTAQVAGIFSRGAPPITLEYRAVDALLVSRTDRNNHRVTFAFDAALKLASASLEMAGTAGYPTIQSSFCAAESTGLNACSAAATASDRVRTLVTGPRYYSEGVPDTTGYYLTKYGAPRKIVNANGDSTVVERSDATWPFLPTAVISPNRHRTESTYHPSRALPLTTTDRSPYGAGDAITTYGWDAVWDKVTSIVLPGSGGTTTIGYDAFTGDRSWQQDGRGTASRVSYFYTNHQLDSLRAPVHANAAAYAYDNLGNLASTRSPLGAVTLYTRNEFGRDSLTTSSTTVSEPFANRTAQLVKYDDFDRPTSSISTGPALGYSVGTVSGVSAPDTLELATAYDNEGNPLQSDRRGSRHRAPLTMTWTYDAANRKLSEAHDGARFRRWEYDAAGNATTETAPARGPSVLETVLATRMTYDVLDRLLTRTSPTVTYPVSQCGVGCGGFGSFLDNRGPIRAPYFIPPGSNGGGAGGSTFVLVGDVDQFAYDAMGNLITATNRNAKIQREYFPNGKLKSDSLAIAVYDRSLNWGVADPYSLHGYGLRYVYDLSGQLAQRTDVAPGMAGNVQAYRYDPQTGLLASSTDNGTTAHFGVDLADRVVHWDVGPWFSETRTYDDDDAIASHVNGVFSDTVAHDARGKAIFARVSPQRVGMPFDQRVMAYTGLGNLAAMSRSAGVESTDEYTTDGFGNVMTREANRGSADLRRIFRSDVQNGETLTAMSDSVPDAASDGRLPPPVSSTSYGFDAAGNQIFAATTALQANPSQHSEYLPTPDGSSWSWSYYDGANRLRLHQESGNYQVGATYPRRTTVAEYRYDALGRRIMVRTLRDSTCSSASNASCPTSRDKLATMERFVWDGSQILYEYRGDGGILADPSTIEFQSPTDAAFHGTVHYFHVGGIDQPIALWKDGSGYIPHLSWRGAFEQVSKLEAPTDPNIYLAASDEDAYRGPDVRQPPRLETMWLGSVVSGTIDPGGLVYMRNRYYDPRAGRFTQEDPIGLGGGLNLYGFAGGDPVNFSDPLGLCPFEKDGIPCGAGGALVGGLAGAGVGVAISAGCASVTFGICAAGAPSIIGATAGLGASIGGAIETAIALLSNGDPAGARGGERAGKPFTPGDKEKIRGSEGNPCTYCGGQTTRRPGREQSQGEHVIPRADGGNGSLDNGVNACRTCNLDKGKRTPSEWKPRWYDPPKKP